jgi:hemoglobin-like flavoprotein
MTPDQIALVRQSFAPLAAQREAVAAAFYDELFAREPGLRTLFGSDLAAQGKKLMAALALVVGGLDRLEALAPELTTLAQRHVAYGVEPQHYDLVGQALIATLAAGLGEAFTPALREAWTCAYGALAKTMVAAAYDPAPA